MPRFTAIAIGCMLGLAVVAGGAAPASAAPDAGNGRKPAHQVPVEEVEEPAAQDETQTSDKPDKAADEDVPAKPPGAAEDADGKTGLDEKPAGNSKDAAASGSGAAFEDAASTKERSPKREGTAKSGGQNAVSKKGTERLFPGLPVRKPPKPVVRTTGRLKPDKKKSTGSRKLPPPGPARDKYLCKALQACRNEFIRCKSKIKYPDQSKEWSIAKEACGAEYSKCVDKDFAAGQWFFTRWFYFEELDCE